MKGIRAGLALGLAFVGSTAAAGDAARRAETIEARGPSGAPRAETTVYDDNPYVAIGAVRFDVRRTVESQIPEGWRQAAVAPSAAAPYRLVKFSGPVGSRERQSLAAAGYVVIASHPYGAFVVRSEPGRPARDLEALDGVTWVGPFHPYFKLDDRLAAAWSDGDPEPWIPQDDAAWGLRFSIGLHETDGRERAEAAIAAAPGVVAPLATRELPLRVQVDPAAFRQFLTAVAALPDVAFIEPWLPARVFNDENVQAGQRGACNNNGAEAPNTTIFNRGITGWGARLVVADVCTDNNEGWFYDDALGRLPAHEPTFPWTSTPADWQQRKIIEYYDMAGNDTTIGCAGSVGCPSSSFCPDHGTHVGGTMAGNCSLDAEGIATATTAANSDGDNDGMAPGAQLVVQDLGNGSLTFVNGGGTLGLLFSVAYDNTCLGPDCGVDAHNNSWGAPGNGYDTNSRTADEALWDRRNGMIFTSAGNSGSSYNTVGAPAVGKNVVAVGAATNCSVNDVWVSSSRGESSDGRLKPDVVAGGAGVTSGRNDGNGTTVANGGCTTLEFSGTSMASPTAAGLSALVLQYFTDGYYPSGAPVAGDMVDPSGPLRKALLINTAQRMTSAASAERNGVTWPNMDQGWGYVVLENSLYFSGDSRKLWVHDEAVGVDVSGTATMTFRRKVTSSAEPLKVTLAWYDVDHAGSCSSTVPCLDNDLDLTVTDESSATTYRVTLVAGTTGTVVPRTVVPSAAGVGQTTTDNGPDDLNPVEQIVIYGPTAGATYSFTVTAANTPDGPIPFALVATGALDPPCTEPAGAAAIGAADLDSCADGGIELSWNQDVSSWNDGGSGTRSYRVLRDGAPIAGGGCAGSLPYGTTGCIDDTGPDNFAASYRVEYTSGCGATTHTATASATDGVAHAVDVTPNGASIACVGQPLDFVVAADPPGPGYLYQWTEDGGDIPSETSDTLALVKSVATSHSYNCRVDNPSISCAIEDPLSVTGTWITDSPSVAYDGTFSPPGSLVKLCGDGDAVVEPGEVWRISLRLKNTAMCSAADDVTAELASGPLSPVAAVTCDNPGDFGDLGPGAAAVESFAFDVDQAAACPSSISFDVDDILWSGGGGGSAAGAFSVAVGAAGNCNVSTTCSCSSIVLGEVSDDPARLLQVAPAGALVNLTFENIGAPNYNVYVSTAPATQPFQVDSGIGKRDCDVPWTPVLGGKATVQNYDLEAGLVSADLYLILVTGDNGPPTEGTLGFTSSSGERSATSRCAK